MLALPPLPQAQAVHTAKPEQPAQSVHQAQTYAQTEQAQQSKLNGFINLATRCFFDVRSTSPPGSACASPDASQRGCGPKSLQNGM